MTETITVGWINEHYTFGWYLTDDGTVITEGPSPADVPFEPLRYNGDVPIYHPVRQRLIDYGEMTAVCRRCGQPSEYVSRHAAELHADDIEVPPARSDYLRANWMQPGWI